MKKREFNRRAHNLAGLRLTDRLFAHQLTDVIDDRDIIDFLAVETPVDRQKERGLAGTIDTVNDGHPLLAVTGEVNPLLAKILPEVFKGNLCKFHRLTMTRYLILLAPWL